MSGAMRRIQQATVVAVGLSAFSAPPPEALASTIGSYVGHKMLQHAETSLSDSAADPINDRTMQKALASSELIVDFARSGYSFADAIEVDYSIIDGLAKEFSQIDKYEDPQIDLVDFLIRRVGLAAARPALVGVLALPDQYEGIRWAILTYLSAHVDVLGCEFTLKVLASAMERGAAGDRAAAAESLGALRVPQANRVLLQALAIERNPSVRRIIELSVV